LGNIIHILETGKRGEPVDVMPKQLAMVAIRGQEDALRLCLLQKNRRYARAHTSWPFHLLVLEIIVGQTHISEARRENMTAVPPLEHTDAPRLIGS